MGWVGAGHMVGDGVCVGGWVVWGWNLSIATTPLNQSDQWSIQTVNIRATTRAPPGSLFQLHSLFREFISLLV